MNKYSLDDVRYSKNGFIINDILIIDIDWETEWMKDCAQNSMMHEYE